MPTRAILKLIPLRKRRESTGIRRGEGHPQYRRDDSAIEYWMEKTSRNGTAQADVGCPIQERSGYDVEFRPLPRCPRCGTAMGFDQKECNSCGREQRKD